MVDLHGDADAMFGDVFDLLLQRPRRKKVIATSARTTTAATAPPTIAPRVTLGDLEASAVAEEGGEVVETDVGEAEDLVKVDVDKVEEVVKADVDDGEGVELSSYVYATKSKSTKE